MATTKPHGEDPGAGRHDRGAASDRDPLPMTPRLRAAPAGESCGTCHFYLGDADDTNGTGQCHKSPPSGLSPGWPVTLATDWCGDYAVEV